MKKLTRSGLTLVELVVATAVISILTIVMMSFLANRIADNAVKNARSDIQLQTQQTLDQAGRDIKHSANVDDQNRWEDSYSPTSPSNNFGWFSDGGTLVLASPAQDQSSNVLWQDHQGYVSYKDNFIYFVSNGSLFKRTLAASIANNRESTTCPSGTSGCPADAQLANNVAEFSIVYYDANDNQVAVISEARSVAITMRVAKTVFSKDLDAQYTVRTVLRNE
jgi:type II secretory pathway pseudopilin PulG